MMDPTRSDTPYSKCHATKEELLNIRRNPLDVTDDCPVCLRFNVFCPVACHPSSGTSSGKIFRIYSEKY